MSVQTKLLRAGQIFSQKVAFWLKASPRIPYLHYWTLRDGTESLVCFHNFFSIFDPGCREPSRATIRVYDSAGQQLAYSVLELPPKANALVDVREILSQAKSRIPTTAEGSLGVDLAPPSDFTLATGRDVGLPVSASRFFMIYRSERGMLATVHCIEEAPTYHGVPLPIGRLMATSVNPRRPWSSKRPISCKGLREVRVVAINHAPGRRRMHLALRRGVDGPVVAEAAGRMRSRGLLTLDYSIQEQTDPSAGHGHYFLSSQMLTTKNGKPYVWVGYGAGPMTLHHG